VKRFQRSSTDRYSGEPASKSFQHELARQLLAILGIALGRQKVPQRISGDNARSLKLHDELFEGQIHAQFRSGNISGAATHESAMGFDRGPILTGLRQKSTKTHCARRRQMRGILTCGVPVLHDWRRTLIDSSHFCYYFHQQSTMTALLTRFLYEWR